MIYHLLKFGKIRNMIYKNARLGCGIHTFVFNQNVQKFSTKHFTENNCDLINMALKNSKMSVRQQRQKGKKYVQKISKTKSFLSTDATLRGALLVMHY